jgi:polysaccharide export outer membrane protein
MNKYTRFLLIVWLAAVFSCRSSQELIYLQDTSITNGRINGLPVDSTEHILQAGDILYVSIKSMNAEVNALFNPESNMESTNSMGYQKFTNPSGAYLYGFEIDPSGIIKLPMLGNLQVAGFSVPEVETIVQKKADEFINDAIVKVKLLNFMVTVMGEVRSPGVYYNYKNTLTVLEAVAMAGGNTDFAAIKKVMVVRPGPQGNQSYMLDLSSKESFMSEAFYLRSNDYVIVQPDQYKNFQLNSQAYSLIFSSLSVLLAVLGFVIQ